MYPIQMHPLLAPVAARLTTAGLLVEPIREVQRVWGVKPRGTLRTANHVPAGTMYSDGTVSETHTIIVGVSLGVDAEPSTTGLSSTSRTGELVWQVAQTYRQMVLVVRAPTGLSMADFEAMVAAAVAS